MAIETADRKTKCNCSASFPDAQFPGIHATDCPDFCGQPTRTAAAERKVPRFEDALGEAAEDFPRERAPHSKPALPAFLSDLIDGLLNPNQNLLDKEKDGAVDHDLRDFPPINIPSVFGPFPPTLPRTKVINGTLVTGILTSSLTLLNDAIASFGPEEEIDITITVARDLIKLALDEIKPPEPDLFFNR
jgi:hypothetical protein